MPVKKTPPDNPAGTPSPAGRLTPAELMRRIAALKSPEERARGLKAFLLQFKPTAIVNRTPEAEELEAKGWEAWLSAMAPHVFRGSFAPFHRKFWNWFWPLLIAKRDGRNLGSLEEPLAYLYTLGRGMGKSSSAEWATIAMGALLGEILVVYVSSTAKLAGQHLNNIKEEIEAAEITRYYPGLSEPEVGKHGNRYGWNQTLLSARSGLTVFAVGLEEEIRGIKRRQHRPALIICDEFDSKDDSPDVVKKKEAIIGGSLFGTQVKDTLIIMAQNLIHSSSVATRTFYRRNELLSYRVESGLVRAFTDDLELQQVGTRWFAVKGVPVWDYFDKDTFQKFLDTSGPIETYAEYQHQFDRDKEGKVFPNYIDKESVGFSHVITEEDFEFVYKTDRPPASWNKYLFNDKALTKTEYHANVAGTLTMSNQNTRLPGITFLYDCISSEANTQPEDFAVEMLKCISPRIRVEGNEYEWEELVSTIITREGIDRFTGSVRDQIRAQREGLARIIPRYVHPLLVSQRYNGLRMSHEAEDWRRVYRESFGMNFEAANPTDGAGVALINLAMRVDPNIVDPFGRLNPDGTPVMGMARFYIIVKKGKRAYPNDNKPDALHGSDLARYQFTEHRNLPPKLNALGEVERGQEKKNDDYPNGLQFFYMDHSIQARELSPEELAEMMMAPHLQLASIKAEPDPEKRQQQMYSREVALRKELTAKLQRQYGGGRVSGAGSHLTDYKRLMRRGT